MSHITQQQTKKALSEDQISAAIKLGFIIYFLGRVKETPGKVLTKEGISFFDDHFPYKWVSKEEIIRWQNAQYRNDVGLQVTGEEFDILIKLYPGFGSTKRQELHNEINYYRLAY
jgi:hypothetical protein